MGISRTEAASALTDIERTAGRSRELKGYQISGPILMVWGVIWALAYAGMGLLPASQWGLVWLPLDVVGIVATILMSRRGLSAARTMAGAGSAAKAGWRIGAGMVAIAAFMVATFAIFQPTTVAPAIVYPGLVTGAIYAGVGIASMPRFLLIGAVVFVASLAGFFFAQPWLAFWMAAVGGGGLFVAGLWLRRA